MLLCSPCCRRRWELSRSTSVLVYGDQGHHKELRDLVMKEMKNNAEFYAAQFLERVEKCLV